MTSSHCSYAACQWCHQITISVSSTFNFSCHMFARYHHYLLTVSHNVDDSTLSTSTQQFPVRINLSVFIYYISLLHNTNSTSMLTPITTTSCCRRHVTSSTLTTTTTMATKATTATTTWSTTRTARWQGQGRQCQWWWVGARDALCRARYVFFFFFFSFTNVLFYL